MNAVNPIKYIDTILADWTSPRVRRLIHLVILLAAVIVSIYLGADGDWKKMIATIITAIYAASNTANTPASGEEPDDDDIPVADPYEGDSEDAA